MASQAVKRDDSALHTTAVRKLGSFAAALAAAGIRSESRRPWTADRTLAALRERRAAGESVSADGRPSGLRSACYRHFGSLVAAREKAGVTGPRSPLWTRERVVEELRAAARGHNGISVSDVSAPLSRASKRRFGTFEAACRAAGVLAIDPPGRPSWSPGRLVAELRARFRRGQATTCATLPQALATACVRHFGSIPAARAAAGLRVASRTAWSRQRIVAELRALARRRQRITIETTGRRLYRACVQHFGSMDAALDAAGFARSAPLAKRWTKPQVRRALRALAGDGRPVSERRAGPELAASIAEHFGTFQAAARAAGVAVAEAASARPPRSGRRPARRRRKC
jgi:hypothetical protein